MEDGVSEIAGVEVVVDKTAITESSDSEEELPILLHIFSELSELSSLACFLPSRRIRLSRISS
jgi:hypothetical protein